MTFLYLCPRYHQSDIAWAQDNRRVSCLHGVEGSQPDTSEELSTVRSNFEWRDVEVSRDSVGPVPSTKMPLLKKSKRWHAVPSHGFCTLAHAKHNRNREEDRRLVHIRAVAPISPVATSHYCKTTGLSESRYRREDKKSYSYSSCLLWVSTSKRLAIILAKFRD